MDPISHAVLGTALTQTTQHRQYAARLGLLGLLAAMAPDLDIVIRSSTNPFLALEYHRQFTHSLAFIPIGGLLCALVFHALIGKRWQISRHHLFWVCTVAYGTHALLDACTTYGTQLLWPFSTARIAWNNVSIVDPLFTLPLITFTALAAWSKRRWLGYLALAWGVVYLGLGVIQRDRAEQAGQQLAQARGHIPQRIEAFPSLGNMLLWRVVYLADNRFYVDAVRINLVSGAAHWAPPAAGSAGSIAAYQPALHTPWLAADSQQARDIATFRWFTNNYVGVDAHNSQRLIDVRYAVLPNDTQTLWAIEANPQLANTEHARFVSQTGGPQDRTKQLGQIWQMLRD